MFVKAKFWGTNLQPADLNREFFKKQTVRAQEGIYDWTRMNSGLKIQLVGKHRVQFWDHLFGSLTCISSALLAVLVLKLSSREVMDLPSLVKSCTKKYVCQNYRMLLTVTVLALSLYMARYMFGNRAFLEMVDHFLIPQLQMQKLNAFFNYIIDFSPCLDTERGKKQSMFSWFLKNL